jgi:Glyoxalase-like domain
MTLRISEICFNCADPVAMAEFWCAAIGYHETERDETGVAIAGAPEAPVILMCVVDDVDQDAKVGHNRLHLDLSPTEHDQDAEVARLEELGARRIDIGQGSPTWVVMADPEGNEFCVLRRQVPPEPEPFAPPG